ncbi:MAG TPA: hypothetical protein IAD33_10965 [Candidatus Scatomorpha gallistercoris]|nr:hypothetical protein [Candidatus Scatomorpha gallistercoris]
MAAFMLLLRGIGMALGGALIWVLFVTVPPWLCGYTIARNSSWWTPDDRIKAYITIKNPRVARRFVPEYIGWNSVIHTDIPLFFNRYTMNKYPERLSLLGAFNYFFVTVTTLFYWVCVTDFLFIHLLDDNWALWAFFALVGEAVIFFALENWNTANRKAPTVVITRQGMKQIRAARRAKKKKGSGKRAK